MLFRSAKPALPLTAAEPSEAQLKTLLQAWLDGKAALLAGNQPALPLDQLARSTEVQRVERQLQANQADGSSESIQAQITAFRISERTPRRIAAEVTLNYSDRRRGSDGQVISETTDTTLRNRYVFGRDGERWLLVAYASAN